MPENGNRLEKAIWYSSFSSKRFPNISFFWNVFVWRWLLLILENETTFIKRNIRILMKLQLLANICSETKRNSTQIQDLQFDIKQKQLQSIANFRILFTFFRFRLRMRCWCLTNKQTVIEVSFPFSKLKHFSQIGCARYTFRHRSIQLITLFEYTTNRS